MNLGLGRLLFVIFKIFVLILIVLFFFFVAAELVEVGDLAEVRGADCRRGLLDDDQVVGAFLLLGQLDLTGVVGDGQLPVQLGALPNVLGLEGASDGLLA